MATPPGKVRLGVGILRSPLLVDKVSPPVFNVDASLVGLDLSICHNCLNREPACWHCEKCLEFLKNSPSAGKRRSGTPQQPSQKSQDAQADEPLSRQHITPECQHVVFDRNPNCPSPTNELSSSPSLFLSSGQPLVPRIDLLSPPTSSPVPLGEIIPETPIKTKPKTVTLRLGSTRRPELLCLKSQKKSGRRQTKLPQQPLTPPSSSPPEPTGSTHISSQGTSKRERRSVGTQTTPPSSPISEPQSPPTGSISNPITLHGSPSLTPSTVRSQQFSDGVSSPIAQESIAFSVTPSTARSVGSPLVVSNESFRDVLKASETTQKAPGVEADHPAIRATCRCGALRNIVGSLFLECAQCAHQPVRNKFAIEDITRKFSPSLRFQDCTHKRNAARRSLSVDQGVILGAPRESHMYYSQFQLPREVRAVAQDLYRRTQRQQQDIWLRKGKITWPTHKPPFTENEVNRFLRKGCFDTIANDSDPRGILAAAFSAVARPTVPPGFQVEACCYCQFGYGFPYQHCGGDQFKLPDYLAPGKGCSSHNQDRSFAYQLITWTNGFAPPCSHELRNGYKRDLKSWRMANSLPCKKADRTSLPELCAVNNGAAAVCAFNQFFTAVSGKPARMEDTIVFSAHVASSRKFPYVLRVYAHWQTNLHSSKEKPCYASAILSRTLAKTPGDIKLMWPIIVDFLETARNDRYYSMKRALGKLGSKRRLDDELDFPIKRLRFQVPCSVCNSPTHVPSDCRNRTCHNCGLHGHLAKDCRNC